MNFLKLSLFLATIFCLAACGDDDDATPTCSQANWTGEYTGTQSCAGISEDVTVTITANGAEAIVVFYETPTGTTEYYPLTPVECDLDVSDSDAGLTITVDASLDGDNLSLIESISAGGATSSCTITATRN